MLKNLRSFSYPKKLIAFFRLSIVELQKVTWLSRKDTVKFTGYVLAFIFFSALSIALLDLGIYRFVTLITVH